MLQTKRSGFIHLFFISAVLSVIYVSYAGEPGIRPKRIVKIAALADFPPQYSLDKNSQPTGFAVDIMDQVAELADLAPDYVVFQDWPEALQALRSGEVDIIPNMGITRRRREYADFTAPLETFPVSIFVRNTESRIKSIEDLSGQKIAVVEVDAGYALLKERRDIELVIARTPSEAIMFLLSGQAVALVFPQPVISWLARRSGIEDRLKVVGKPLKEIARGIAVRKGDTALLSRLDTAVRRFVITKTYKRIFARWYGLSEVYWTRRRIFTAAALILTFFAGGLIGMRHVTLFRISKRLEKRVRKSTEELKTSEENFRLIFETAFFGIAIHDIVLDEQQKPVDYIFINANPAFYDIFDFETGSVPGKLGSDLFGMPEAPLLEEFSAVALEKQSFEKEIEIIPMEKIIKMAAYSYRHGSFVTVVEDITARKQTEAKLKDVTRKLELAQELGRSGWWEYDLINKKAIWPEASYALFGLDPAKTTLDGKSIRQFIQPEYTEDYSIQIRKLIDEGFAEFLYPILPPNGQTRWIWARGETEYDDAGHPVRLFGMLQDITERKEYELQLMESRRRVQTIIDVSPIPLALIDANENITYINQAFIDTLGYTLKDSPTLEEWWSKAYPDAAYRKEVIDEWWRRVAQSEKDQALFVPMETNIRCKDGSICIMLATSTLLKGFAEKTRLVTLYNITQTKTMSQRLKTLLATASDGIHVLDEEGNVIEFSDSFARMLGYTVEEAARLNVADWDAQIPRDDLGPLIKERIRSSITFETKHRRKDGSVFDVEINAKGIVLDGRRLLYASSRDITQRKEMEEAHRQSEAKFRQLFQVTDVPLCYVRTDGVVLEVNRKFVETFGYDKDDIQTIERWWTLAYPDPQYRRWVKDTWNAAMRKATDNHETIQTEEYQITCKNGEVRNILIGGSIFEDYFLATFFDITEMKKAEKSLRYYETIASSVDILLSLVDRNMVYLQVNDALAGIYGRTREDIVGKPMQEILSPQTYLQMKSQIKRSLSGEIVFEEMWLDSPEQRKRIYNVIRYPMFDENGEVYAVAGVGYDMTEIYQANEALTLVNAKLKQVNESLRSAKKAAESANRAKSFFLSNMTHELRTPLNAILGYTQILSADKTLGAKQMSGIQTIHQAGEHLLMIINDVLDMSKIEAGKLQLVTSQIELVPFFQNIMDFFNHRAQEKRLNLTFETRSALPAAIVGDELRLRQVIFNLLSNAIKFTAKGYCRLQVEATYLSKKKCRLEIDVEDSGVGIPQDQQEEVFEPFKQVGERLQYKEGSGLGLAISKQLVHLMGGRIALTSPVNTSPNHGAGGGSCFSLTIESQVAQIDRTVPLQESKKIVGYKRTEDTSQPVRILVVDDKATNRAVLRDTLEPLGFAIQEAADGIAVPEICLKNKPDLIFMDLRMPNVDGFSAMSTLKRHHELQDIPVIALTASMVDAAMLEKRCIEHGFRALILKPFLVSALLEKTAQVLPITLVYQKDHETGPDDVSQIEIPPAREIAKLSTSLSKGDIEKILEYAETIGQLENGRYLNFGKMVRTLAKDFKFSELENLILSKGKS